MPIQRDHGRLAYYQTTFIRQSCHSLKFTPWWSFSLCLRLQQASKKCRDDQLPMETHHPLEHHESKPVRRTGSQEALFLSFESHLNLLCLKTKKSDCWPSAATILWCLEQHPWSNYYYVSVNGNFLMLTDGASFFLKTALNFPPAWMMVPFVPWGDRHSSKWTLTCLATPELCFAGCFSSLWLWLLIGTIQKLV